MRARLSVIPLVSCGPFRFGMSRVNVEALAPAHPEFYDFEFDAEGLAALMCDPEPLEAFSIGGVDLLALSPLDAALHVASLSERPGQAQGGSLYCEDIGLAIWQFETPHREFKLFSSGYVTGEPLRPVTAADLRDYYERQTRADAQ